MENIDKIVDFQRYCSRCKYKDLPEGLDPCNECLNNYTNINTQIPVNYILDESYALNEKQISDIEKWLSKNSYEFEWSDYSLYFKGPILGTKDVSSWRINILDLMDNMLSVNDFFTKIVSVPGTSIIYK